MKVNRRNGEGKGVSEVAKNGHGIRSDVVSAFPLSVPSIASYLSDGNEKAAGWRAPKSQE